MNKKSNSGSLSQRLVVGTTGKIGPKPRKIATTRDDFVVVRLDGTKGGNASLPQERASSLVGRVAAAMKKPGLSKDRVFGKSSGMTKIYAYSVDPTDTTKIVREDKTGNRETGRLVKGAFRLK